MRSLTVQVYGRLTPGHLKFDGEDELPVDIIPSRILLVHHFCMWQTLRHRDKPAAFLALERHRVDLLHHCACEARAIAKEHVSIGPLELEYVSQRHLKSWMCSRGPAKNLLVYLRWRLCDILVILCLQVDRYILQRF